MAFEVVLRSRPTTPAGVLLIVDDQREAEEIVNELRGKGHDVLIRPSTADRHQLLRPGQREMRGRARTPSAGRPLPVTDAIQSWRYGSSSS